MKDNIGHLLFKVGELRLAVSQILRVKPGGFVLLALVCSSFSVMWSPQPASNVEVLNRATIPNVHPYTIYSKYNM